MYQCISIWYIKKCPRNLQIFRQAKPAHLLCLRGFTVVPTNPWLHSQPEEKLLATPSPPSEFAANIASIKHAYFLWSNISTNTQKSLSWTSVSTLSVLQTNCDAMWYLHLEKRRSRREIHASWVGHTSPVRFDNALAPVTSTEAGGHKCSKSAAGFATAELIALRPRPCFNSNWLPLVGPKRFIDGSFMEFPYLDMTKAPCALQDTDKGKTSRFGLP